MSADNSYSYLLLADAHVAELLAEIADLRALIRTIGGSLVHDNDDPERWVLAPMGWCVLGRDEHELWASIVKAGS